MLLSKAYVCQQAENVLSPLFVQLMHTNYYKIVKQLKSLKITIVAPTCFRLHKPSSGSSQSVLVLKLSVLWLHICSHNTD